ncbi:MAG: ribosome recycling factor [Proteobacteria bacterium]|nr:ribosome recycling factor [Pseudomonadota bacterium]
MIDEAHEELRTAVAKSHEALRRELSKLRTGRANPALLESLRVDSYGQPTPIHQMATVGVPEPRLLTIKAWDRSQVKAIERAILESDLGLNPQSDGELIRVPLPPLTEDRRKELVKIARKYGEDAKVSIRKARHNAKDLLSTLREEGEASEDEVERASKRVEEIVQKATAEVDAIVGRKESDILAL